MSEPIRFVLYKFNKNNVICHQSHGSELAEEGKWYFLTQREMRRLIFWGEFCENFD